MHFKMIFRFLAVCLFLLFAVINPVFSQEEISVPVPPQSERLDTHVIPLEGMKISSFLFSSKVNPDTVNKFYLNYFEKNKFEPIYDKAEKDGKLLRFRKEDLVVNVVITPKQGQTQVVIAQYHQPVGSPGPEELLQNWKNMQVLLPDSDVAGEDLEFIPRPPDSIRILYKKDKQYTLVSYVTQASTQELLNFYRYKMLGFGWEAQETVNMQDVFSKAEGTGAIKKIPQLPIAGISMEEIAQKSYILNFKSSAGKVKVSLINNSSGQGGKNSFVQISYVQEK